MNSLALINEFLGQPPNASSHGYQIDHIIEFCHWFMGALFLGWSAFFIFVLIRFRKRRHPDASGILRCLDRSGPTARVRDSALGETRESVSAGQRSAPRPRRWPAV